MATFHAGKLQQSKERSVESRSEAVTIDDMDSTLPTDLATFQTRPL